MTEAISYVIIAGSGLVGLRPAISAASKTKILTIVVISKVQAMHSHSVSVEGGITVLLFEDEGDN